MVQGPFHSAGINASFPAAPAMAPLGEGICHWLTGPSCTYGTVSGRE